MPTCLSRERRTPTRSALPRPTVARQAAATPATAPARDDDGGCRGRSGRRRRREGRAASRSGGGRRDRRRARGRGPAPRARRRRGSSRTGMEQGPAERVLGGGEMRGQEGRRAANRERQGGGGHVLGIDGLRATCSPLASARDLLLRVAGEGKVGKRCAHAPAGSHIFLFSESRANFSVYRNLFCREPLSRSSTLGSVRSLPERLGHREGGAPYQLSL